MVQPKKIFTVDNFVAKLKDAKGLVFADYQGLTVSQLSSLRRQFKAKGAEFEIVKNTLLRLAAKNGDFPLDHTELTGPTATLWIYDDDPTTLKILYQFVKENELPKVKLGYWNGQRLSDIKLLELSQLPSFDELRAKLLGTLNSPVSKLTYSLKFNLTKLALVLKAISVKTQN
jgi:large subunit ribosomal protein L10